MTFNPINRLLKAGNSEGESLKREMNNRVMKINIANDRLFTGCLNRPAKYR
jgi:hypothetical protein